MNRQLIMTDDGSHSMFVPEINEQYHSRYGAIQESEHVFIKSGLEVCSKKEITVFEMGFGTGLNAFLSLIFSEINNLKINYLSVEKFPLTAIEFEGLNYANKIEPAKDYQFMNLHRCKWNEPVTIAPHFTIHKIENDFRKINIQSLPFFDLVFFDAFAPDKQPDLWNEEIYSTIFDHCNPKAIFVTYCSKGIVRRGLQQVGFKVERIPGPPGKKEMLRAIK